MFILLFYLSCLCNAFLRSSARPLSGPSGPHFRQWTPFSAKSPISAKIHPKTDTIISCARHLVFSTLLSVFNFPLSLFVLRILPFPPANELVQITSVLHIRHQQQPPPRNHNEVLLHEKSTRHIFQGWWMVKTEAFARCLYLATMKIEDKCCTSDRQINN